MPSILLVNGRLYDEETPAISALDRGFTLGDGVFETMRAFRGRVFRLSPHLARLRQGASVLQLPLPPEEALVADLQQVLARLAGGHAAVRLTVSRGVDRGRGVAFPAASSPTVVIRAGPLVPYPEELYRRGAHAAVSSVRRNEGSPLSRIKSTNYGDAILARAEAQARGYDEALMLNNRGEVACVTTANVFIVMEGRLQTPPVESGVLPGITRACVFDLAKSLSLQAEETPFALPLLQDADEALLTNSLGGIFPLTQVEEQPIGEGRPGPITIELAAAYRRLVQAELGL